MGWWPLKKNKLTRQPQLMAGQTNYIFRRSRTLTGTTSNKVITPVASPNAHLKSPRQRLHELYEARLKIIKLLMVCLLGVAVFGFLVLNYIITPKLVYPQHGGGQVSAGIENSYRQSISHYFSIHPLEHFGFLLDTQQLQEYMFTEHSEISQFIVNKSWYGGGVSFVVSFRQPILVWQTGSRYFYVDSSGVAFAYNHFSDGLVSVTDQSGITPSTGTSVASHHFIYFLGMMVGALNRGSGGKVSSVTIPASTREIDVQLKGRGYTIRTDIDRDPLQEAEDILNALKYFDAHKIVPQYIDARVAGKVFYK